MMNMPPFYSSASGGGGGFPTPALLLNFEDGAGTTMADTSPHARVLTGYSTCKVITSDSKFGTGCLQITQRDGGGISIPSSADFGTSSKWAVAFWFKHVSTPAFTSAPDIFRITGSAGGTIGIMNWAAAAQTAVNFGSGQQIAPAAATSNAWHHAYIAFDASMPIGQTGCICVDGVQVVLVNGSVWSGSAASIKLFGNTGSPGAADTTDYRIDSFALWIGDLPHSFAGGFTPPSGPY